MFIVDDVQAGDIRGDHAHRTCHQLLICTVGRVIVTAQPAEGSALEFDLTPNTGAVHIPPLVWATQRYEEHESQLVVLASEPYSPTEYIRDPEEFKALTGADLDLSDAVPVRP